MKISASDAREALAYLDRHSDNAAAARHDVDLSRRGIRPYYSQVLETAYAVLDIIARSPKPVTEWRAKLARIAGTP